MKFGTKGFLSAMIAMQIAASPHLFADNAKKSTKGSLKKVGRKVTGQEKLIDEQDKADAQNAAESKAEEAVTSPLKDATKGKVFN